MGTNAEKLIDTAFSDGSYLWGLSKYWSAPDERPKVLALGVSHDEDTGSNFIINNVKKLESRHVVADFMELPYWYNAIFTGYRKGIVTDAELQEHFGALISTQDPDNEPEFKADLKRIQTLKSRDIPTIAIDVRIQNRNIVPLGLRDSFDRAEELAGQYPDIAESIKYSGYIEEALARGVPADAVTASLVSMHLAQKKGNGILTYGNFHFSGACVPPEEGDIQAILDEALEKQGVNVTHATIAKNGYEFRALESSLQSRIRKKSDAIQAGKESWIECKDTADLMDFIYLEEGDGLIPKESFSKHKIQDFFPESRYPKAEEVYKNKELDPTLIKELQKELKAAGVTQGAEAISLPLSQPSAQGKGHNTSQPRK